MYTRHDYQAYNNQYTNGYYNTTYENNFQTNTNTQDGNIAWPSPHPQLPDQQQQQPLHHKMVYPAEMTQNNNPR